MAVMKCPVCENEISEEMEICPWCGRKIPKKPDKKLFVRVGIITAGVILLVIVCGLWIYMQPVIKQEKNYKKAAACLEQGQYDEAMQLFDALGDYRDSENKAEECRAGKKEYIIQTDYRALTQDEYEQNISYFKKLGDEEALRVIYYKYGQKYMDDGDYEHAARYFERVMGYKDAEDYLREAIYKDADNALSSKEYIKAVSLFEKYPDYKDSPEKILEAMYAYVCEHKSNTDANTRNYLTQLVEADYKDSGEIYDAVYPWKLTITAINDSKNSNTNMTSIHSENTIYFHFKLDGGAPGEKTKIYYDMIWPNGSESTDASSQEWSGGSTGELCFKAKTAGTFFVTFYDEKRNELGSGNIEIIE